MRWFRFGRQATRSYKLSVPQTWFLHVTCIFHRAKNIGNSEWALND